MPDYFPNRDTDLSNWCSNYKSKIAVHGPTVGLTAAEISTQQGYCDNIIDQIAAVEQDKNDLAASIENKKDVVKTRKTSLRQDISRLKTHSAFTQAIGDALGVIGGAGDFDPDTFKPAAKATVFPGLVRIDFNKSQTDGANVYTRLQGAMPWTKLGTDNFPPYDDTRPLANPNTPETREYQVRAIVNDVEIGLASDIVSAVFGG